MSAPGGGASRRAAMLSDNRIAVDWDGTCVEDAWPAMGGWLPGAVDALAAFIAAGYEVVILSTRLAPMDPDECTPRPDEQQREIELVREMLDDAGLEDVDIWTDPWKPGALAYIDDKAIRFSGRWADTAAAILGRTETPSQRAFELVRGTRQSDYGHPLDNHERIAAFWTVRLGDKLLPGAKIEPHEATAMMRLVKEARLMQTVGHEDSLDDIPGYADVEFEIHREVRRRALQAVELVDEPPLGTTGT